MAIWIDSGNKEYQGQDEENWQKAYVDRLLKEHIDNKDNPHEVTKIQVGLANCENTRDSSKNVAHAVTADNLKPPVATQSNKFYGINKNGVLGFHNLQYDNIVNRNSPNAYEISSISGLTEAIDDLYTRNIDAGTF